MVLNGNYKLPNVPERHCKCRSARVSDLIGLISKNCLSTSVKL